MIKNSFKLFQAVLFYWLMIVPILAVINPIPFEWSLFYEKHKDASLEKAISSDNTDRALLQWLVTQKQVPFENALSVIVDNHQIDLLDFFILNLEICGKPHTDSFFNDTECDFVLDHIVETSNIEVLDYFAPKFVNLKKLMLCVSSAVEEGNLQVVQHLIEIHGVITKMAIDEIDLPINVALHEKFHEISNYLLQKESTVMDFDTLFLAAKTGKQDLYEEVKSRYQLEDESQRHEIQKSSDLLFEVVNERVSQVSKLLDEGADPNLETRYTNTCLFEAFSMKLKMKILALLLVNGAKFRLDPDYSIDLAPFHPTYYATEEGKKFLDFYLSHLESHTIWTFLEHTCYNVLFWAALSNDKIENGIPLNLLLNNAIISSNILFRSFMMMTKAILDDDIGMVEELSYLYPNKFKFLSKYQASSNNEGHTLVDLAFALRHFKLTVFLIRKGFVMTIRSLEYKQGFRRNGLEETEDEKEATLEIENAFVHSGRGDEIVI